MSKAEVAAVEGSLTKALDIGVAELDKGGTSLDAVERHPLPRGRSALQRRRGSCFNAEESVSSMLHHGRRTKACGAVASVRTVKNPISLARLVMTKTRHVLLVADGAEKFASEMKVERVDQQYYFTQKAFDEWQKKRDGEKASPKSDEGKKGTVGCAALDSHGNLAAGTSTGGLTNKKAGRVGDSPIIGGTYADNACGLGRHRRGHPPRRRLRHLFAGVRVTLPPSAISPLVSRKVTAASSPSTAGNIIKKIPAASPDGGGFQRVKGSWGTVDCRRREVIHASAQIVLKHCAPWMSSFI
jgi:hypothetical protein